MRIIAYNATIYPPNPLSDFLGLFRFCEIIFFSYLAAESFQRQFIFFLFYLSGVYALDILLFKEDSMFSKKSLWFSALLLGVFLVLTGCDGPVGPEGPAGPSGPGTGVGSAIDANYVGPGKTLYLTDGNGKQMLYKNKPGQITISVSNANPQTLKAQDIQDLDNEGLSINRTANVLFDTVKREIVALDTYGNYSKIWGTYTISMTGVVTIFPEDTKAGTLGKALSGKSFEAKRYPVLLSKKMAANTDITGWVACNNDGANIGLYSITLGFDFNSKEVDKSGNQQSAFKGNEAIDSFSNTNTIPYYVIGDHLYINNFDIGTYTIVQKSWKPANGGPFTQKLEITWRDGIGFAEGIVSLWR